MKKFTLSLAVSLLIMFSVSVLGAAGEVKKTEDKFIRIHIIANSDSKADQALKLTVRDRILEKSGEYLTGAKTKEEAVERIRKNLSEIESEAQKAAGDEKVDCSFEREYFEPRAYDGFILPAGMYDSLCIRIGEANGKNWWCVCYPEVCIGAAIKIEDSEVFSEGEIKILREPSKVRYKLWCYETLLKLKKLFSHI